MEPHASPLVSLGIPSLAVLTVACVVGALYVLPECGPRYARRFASCAGLWLLLTAWLAASGALRRFEVRPPPTFLLFVSMMAIGVGFAASRWGAALARHTPLFWLVGFHAFRLPLELVMHVAADEGTMPEQMTFTGANFDIATGISAIVVAVLCATGHAPRALVIVWNLLGTLLLAAIIVIAVASLPLFHAFGSEPARLNTWVLYFPFVWLPAVLVTAAWAGHLVLWRKLLAERVR
jgi:small-conductance mechanosensitive channel